MAWLSWLIALFKGWLTWRADQHDNEQQEVGATKQSNADLTTTGNVLSAELQDAVNARQETTQAELRALQEGKA